MPDQSRIQARVDDAENTWKDVGFGTDNTPLPVEISELLPTLGNNPITIFTGLAETGNNLTQQKTINSVDYQRTFTYSGTGPYTLTISAWEQL